MKSIFKSLVALLLIITMTLSILSCGVNTVDSKEETPDNTQTEQKQEEFYIEGPNPITMTEGESITLTVVVPDGVEGEIIWTSSSTSVSVSDGIISAKSKGTAIVQAILGDQKDSVIITVSGEGSSSDGGTTIVPDGTDPVTSDPYVNVDTKEFYSNYTPAISYMDAYYRSQHNLMSGSIGKQDQKPTIASYQPMENGKYVRNSTYLFSEDGNTYYVVDGYGEIVLEVYKGGAYIMLEEVAAYVFAFGEPPANHSADKKTKPTASVWGIYLRVNNTKFSGNVNKYPYEPVLPRISGCGGDLVYYEMDIGTTGTDCDPNYSIREYNNGSSITRGAARIVYSCQDTNGNKIIDLDERYVFYTYNHYNDFQEYWNYYGGWGEMFGNVTGGGTLSSEYDYNPTPYVEVVRKSISKSATSLIVVYYLPIKEYVA